MCVLKKLSLRAKDWRHFSRLVLNHIEIYTIPQYGDKGADIASDYTVDDCFMQMKRYILRHGKNSREGQDRLDLLKIAHYAEMAYTLIEERDNAKSN